MKSLPEGSFTTTLSYNFLKTSQIDETEAHEEQAKREKGTVVRHHPLVLSDNSRFQISVARFDACPSSSFSTIPSAAIFESVQIHLLEREHEIPSSAEVKGMTSDNGNGSGENMNGENEVGLRGGVWLHLVS